jgi:probable F420-dependent oxidoreductase
MLRLAAQRTHGALPFGVPVEHTARTRELLGPDAFLGVVQAVILAPDNASTREQAYNYVAESLPNRADVLRGLGFSVDLTQPGADRLVRAMVVWGDPDAVAARIAEHRAAGADHVCLSVVGNPPEQLPLAQWRELATLTG